MSNQIKGTILILISALMFGAYGVFAKYLSQYDIFFQTYIRCLIITAILIVVGLIKKEFKPIEKQDWKWFGVVLFFTAFSVAPIIYAFKYIEIGTASFLFYASFTICTYIFGLIFFKEKLTVIKSTSLALAFIGMLLIFPFKSSGVIFLAPLMALLNGLASSGEVTFSKKISHKYSNTQIVALVFGFIGVTHIFISLALGEHQNISLLTHSFFPLITFSLAAIIGMFTVVEGFKYVEPSIGAIIGLMEIIFSVMFGVLLFGESLTTMVIFGGFLIIVAVALPDIVNLLNKNKK